MEDEWRKRRDIGFKDRNAHGQKYVIWGATMRQVGLNGKLA